MEQCNADPSAIDLYLEGFGLLARRAVELDQATDEDGQSLLHLVAKQGPAEFIDILINLGLDLNGLERRSRTPSFVTVLEGRSTVLDRLIKFQADLNKADEDGDTPLIIAAMDGKLAISLLLSKGADMDYQKRDLWTPMHLSACWGHGEVVRLLLEKGANPNQVTNEGETSLHLA
ncbi:ankyrin, partial [Aspergillus indologenus CBS 114.80]